MLTANSKIDKIQDKFSWELLSVDGSKIVMAPGIILSKLSYVSPSYIVLKILYDGKTFSIIELPENSIPVFYFTCLGNLGQGKTESILNYGYKIENLEVINHIFLSSMVE